MITNDKKDKVKIPNLKPVMSKQKICDVPVIHKMNVSEEGLKEYKDSLEKTKDAVKLKLLFQYPVVYIHHCPDGEYYEVYIGETADIINRTHQHFCNVAKDENWQKMLKKKGAEVFIIGHKYFNKSLTMDIENMLMFYMLGVEKVRKIHNRRGNLQNKYYTSDKFEDIFSDVWKGLGKMNAHLFPAENLILDSALYKASPFHELSDNQKKAKLQIFNRVREALKQKKRGQLIFVSGEAGTGKTVLNSNLFYELCTNNKELGFENIKCRLMVNHEEQLTVYKQIAAKLCLDSVHKDIVCNPTHFILTHKEEDEPIDIAFVDEAHLLWTQGNQAYRGKNQLEDILKRARVVVAVFDQYQILSITQYWEHAAIEKLEKEAKRKHNYIELTEQFRICGGAPVIEWIHKFTKKQQINKIPEDAHYEIKIFDSPGEMQQEIEKKGNNENSRLSRMLSTYDWEYIQKKSPRMADYWMVSIGEWKMPWNKQMPGNSIEKGKNKKLAWSEQSHTIKEVGSTYTIQGLDLNYAGVILGPSVQYKDGKIVFDPSCSANRNVKNARTLSDGSKKKFGEILIRNEVNVLMTRGIDGLYIYACDEELRRALKKAKDK
ncbi:MAG: DUF2075 domain-containing protein [Lachnospiraceae bacterium]|jgi:hypothetical protein|nr:hypothetical protein C819_02313 [Lachnospiraceae bacterium 10-1]MCX4350299.1 DUF2075 domain-containing protein [Lachnospiraceae bacterium]